MSGFTSVMERKRNETTSQARLPGISEDVKKKLRFWVKLRFAQWSEVLRLRSTIKNKSRTRCGLIFQWWRWGELNPCVSETQRRRLHVYSIFDLFHPSSKPIDRPESRLFIPLISPWTEWRLSKARTLSRRRGVLASLKHGSEAAPN